jgi:hypothetical protein
LENKEIIRGDAKVKETIITRDIDVMASERKKTKLRR